MIRIGYTTNFIKAFKKLETDLKNEALEKIDLFKYRENHKQIKAHKLKGRLKGRYSFSVNYKFRIVFYYKSPNNAILLSIGDHNIYK